MFYCLRVCKRGVIIFVKRYLCLQPKKERSVKVLWNLLLVCSQNNTLTLVRAALKRYLSVSTNNLSRAFLNFFPVYFILFEQFTQVDIFIVFEDACRPNFLVRIIFYLRVS